MRLILNRLGIGNKVEETKKLKNTFNLIFVLIMALIFVTVSSLVNELYLIHKNEKNILVKNIIESFSVQYGGISEEFFVEQDISLNMRISRSLSKYKIDDYEVVKISNGDCVPLGQNSSCSNDFKTLSTHSVDTITSVNVNDFTMILIPIKMFQNMIGKIIVKIPHSYTTVNRLVYITINVIPLFVLVLLWIVLYRFIERKILTPQIEKIAEFESNRRLYHSVLKVTHDLRAPVEVLNQLSGYLSNTEYGELMKLSTTRVTNIVNSCLEESRIKNEDYVIVDLNEKLQNLIKEFRFKSELIVFSYSSTVENKVYMERESFIMLERSISNMITNSIESIIDRGRIDLSINPYDVGVSISVKDSGTGIESSHKKLIFTDGYTTKRNGNGIGLSSTFKWIKSIKGKLECTSEFGEGCQFTLFVPCEFKA